MSHSLGTWSVDDLGDIHFAETNNRYGILWGSRRIAKIEGVGERSEANAELVSAAPDLLEAVEAVLEQCLEPIEIRKLCRAARNKARGIK